MFERYTEKARRVIFFARYEASQFGAPAIEPEHLLLGLMREDKTLTARFLARAQTSLEAIRKEIEGRAPLREKISTSVELPLAPETKRVLAYAHEESDRLQHRHIGTEHLLLGLLREERSMAAEILYERGLKLHAVREEISRSAGGDPRAAQKKETPHLAEFSRDLTDDAANDKLDPLVGREGEIERVVQILCRRTKNNPVLIGEPGVGKTAIVEGLAQRIVRGEVPSFLENKRILSLDLSLIVAGTKYRGQFEERLKQIMRELVENPQYIVFIDELHTLVGAGSAEGSLDAANILKPALSRGEIQCIGATTPAEFRKSIEKDRSLERRFQAVKVPPPTEEEAVSILDGVRERYEAFHQVRYTADAIEAAVYQSNRYIPDRFLPDKAIDVIDEAGARVKLRARRDAPGGPAPRGDLFDERARRGEVCALYGEGDVVDRAVFVEGLNNHVHIDTPPGERRKDFAGDARSVGDFQDGQPRLILVNGDAADRAINLHLVCSSQNRAGVVGVKGVAHAQRQAVLAGQLDRARVQHLRADPRHLKHLFVGDLRHQPRGRHNVRVSRVDAADVRVDVADIGLERRRQRHRRRVRAAAPQRRGIAILRDPLKAGGDDDVAVIEKAADTFGLDVNDARRCVNALGDDAELRAGHRNGFAPHLVERHRHERNRNLLAGRQQRVILAPVRRLRHLIGQLDQIVGRVAHRRNDDDNGTLRRRARYDTGDVAYARDGLDRCASELLNNHKQDTGFGIQDSGMATH
jgi:hypothetical protein